MRRHPAAALTAALLIDTSACVITANRLLAERCDYPLHLGVTEAGPAFQGAIKSAVAFGVLLAEGIGDTIRVSLSAPPVEQVTAGTTSCSLSACGRGSWRSSPVPAAAASKPTSTNSPPRSRPPLPAFPIPCGWR